MTVETRTALLVGLAIIILFGLVLGQRSLQVCRGSSDDGPDGVVPPSRPGGEVMTPRVEQTQDRPVLSPPRPRRASPPVAPEQQARPAARPSTPDQSAAKAPVAQPPPKHYEEMTLKALSERFERAQRPRTYVVRRGDCLTRIARRQMGDGGPRTVKKLYQANRDRIRDPDRLRIGLKLRIPG